MPHFKKEHIIISLNRLVKFANDNVESIQNLSFDINDEYHSTYLGMIIRQSNLCYDLSLLLSNKKHKNLSSEHILLRCIVDDYINFHFITNQENSYEVLTNFNADAINKNFRKIKELADMNERDLGGNYPFYPTYFTVDKLKEEIKSSPYRQQYFLDKENFKFKTFKSTGNLIRELTGNEHYSAQLRRAYFVWRKFSDFVHFSNFTFEHELSKNPLEDSTYDEFSEIISYSYHTIQNCLKHFRESYEGFKIIDSQNLKDYYSNSVH